VGIRHKLNMLPSLLPEERVLLRKGWLWAASAKSLPMTYRWDMSLPPVCEIGPYLEVISEDPARHWYRSDRLRLRLFMKSAEQYHEVIAAVMGTTS
jgi:hypothetical protein